MKPLMHGSIRRQMESLSLVGIILLLLIACGTMVYEAAWADSGPGLSSLPEPGKWGVSMALMLLYTVQAAIAVTALFLRRISFLSVFLAALVAAPSVLIYSSLVSVAGFGAPAVQFDEFARVTVAGLAALLLSLPWVFKRLSWPARSPGHLAIGIAILTGVALQVIFHLILVNPGAKLSHGEFERVRQVIEASADPEELARLSEIGAVPIISMERATAAALLQKAGAINVDSALKSIDAILTDKPPVLHVWRIPGQSTVDRLALIYDGRKNEPEKTAGPQLWLLPSTEFLLPRLTAISAYYYLTGLSSLVWITGALLVHNGHARRQGQV